MSCMGTLLALSPEIWTRAFTTGPQVNEATNGVHSAIELPFASTWPGRGMVTAEPRMRNPKEPVSTRISLTVWHSDVPGTHTVTEVNKPLAKFPSGPRFTLTG